jgi:hypothetical protein
VPVFNDAALAGIFEGEVITFLVSTDPIGIAPATKILSWHHTGSGIQSWVRTTTQAKIRKMARCVAKPIPALRGPLFGEAQGKAIGPDFPKQCQPT